MCNRTPEGIESDVQPPSATAQAVTGQRVGVGEKAQCILCEKYAQEGANVTVYAYRPAGKVIWSAARLYCETRDYTTIKYPSLGCEEVIIRARLAITSDVATQSSFLSLIDVSAVDYGGRYEGAHHKWLPYKTEN